MIDHKSLRDSILGAKDFTKRPVKVPEWGLESGLFVKAMNLLDALAYNEAVEGMPDAKSVPFYVAYALCDEEGRRIFDPIADLDELAGKNQKVLTRLFNEALAVNGEAGQADPEAPGKS